MKKVFIQSASRVIEVRLRSLAIAMCQAEWGMATESRVAAMETLLMDFRGLSYKDLGTLTIRMKKGVRRPHTKLVVYSQEQDEVILAAEYVLLNPASLPVAVE